MPVRQGEVGETIFQLAARELALEYDGPALIEPDEVKDVLADIDTDYGNLCVGFR
jgi:hypothetical protein